MKEKLEEKVEGQKVKKKFFKDKKDIVIVILSIFLLISIAGNSTENELNVITSSNLASTIAEKEETIEENEQQIKNLQNINEKLEKDKQALLIEKE